jgi:hypothetical protein
MGWGVVWVVNIAAIAELGNSYVIGPKIIVNFGCPNTVMAFQECLWYL